MKISAGTIARTVVLLIALVNSVLVTLGVNTIPLAEETVTEFISLAFTGIAALTAWWKNNSFTPAAIEGDRVKDELKKKQ